MVGKKSEHRHNLAFGLCKESINLRQEMMLTGKKWSRLFGILFAAVGGIFFLLQLLVGPVRAATLTVCASGCNYTSVAAAVQEANFNLESDDLIIVGDGTYEGDLAVFDSMTIRNADGAAPILRGTGSDRVLYVTGDITVTLQGLIIENGNAAQDGGGLYNEEGFVTIQDTIFRSNSAGDSGGAIANADRMLLHNVVITGNQAPLGAGVAVLAEATISMTQVTVQNNATTAFASEGGGLYNAGIASLERVTVTQNTVPGLGGGLGNIGELTISQSTITQNSAEAGAGIANSSRVWIEDSRIANNTAVGQDQLGGGIYNTFFLELTESTVADNTGARGAGIYQSGYMTITQSTLSGNHSTGNGAGIYVGSNFPDEIILQMVNSTVSGNAAGGSGGGFYFHDMGDISAQLNNVTVANNDAIQSAAGLRVAGGSVSLKNSILENDAGANCVGMPTSLGQNTASDTSCMLSGSGDLQGVASGLGPLADNGGKTQTHALFDTSINIDRGLDCPAVDQRGVTRPIGFACDRGAYESSVENYYNFLPLLRK
jgi:predicted outer membrane repeat protein